MPVLSHIWRCSYTNSCPRCGLFENIETVTNLQEDSSGVWPLMSNRMPEAHMGGVQMMATKHEQKDSSPGDTSNNKHAIRCCSKGASQQVPLPDSNMRKLQDQHVHIVESAASRAHGDHQYRAKHCWLTDSAMLWGRQTAQASLLEDFLLDF